MVGIVKCDETPVEAGGRTAVKVWQWGVLEREAIAAQCRAIYGIHSSIPANKTTIIWRF